MVVFIQIIIILIRLSKPSTLCLPLVENGDAIVQILADLRFQIGCTQIQSEQVRPHPHVAVLHSFP